jgi:hypothetical protein
MNQSQESIVTPVLPPAARPALSAAEVKRLLREIAFVLHVTQRVKRAIVSEAGYPVRPAAPADREVAPAACAA